jgi:hypothetical protein
MPTVAVSKLKSDDTRRLECCSTLPYDISTYRCWSHPTKIVSCTVLNLDHRDASQSKIFDDDRVINLSG